MHASRSRKRTSAFTLVEILIVVVILGILAAIVVPQFTSAANEARGGNVATQEATLGTQLELWAARNNGLYPTVAELNTNATGASSGGWGPLIDENYVKSPPRNPFAPVANQSLVTAHPFSDAASASDDAADEDASQGWLYDASKGIIRAARGAVDDD